MSRTIEVFEHGTLHVSEGVGGISQVEFDALVRFNDEHGRRFFDIGHRRISLKSFVGYVEVGGLCIEILPKADRHAKTETKVWRDGLLEMLRVALGMRLERPSAASQQLARFQLLDLIALGFLSEVEPLLHQGLAKGYRSLQENGALFRGKLRVAEHIKVNSFRRDRFLVEYEAYDQDVLVNRLLNAGFQALQERALSPGIATRLQACRSRFPSVQRIDANDATFDRLRLGRATQRYEIALLYARMILSNQGPQLQRGKRRVFALLFDMNSLWERYVSTLLRGLQIPGVIVRTQERHLFWSPLSLRGRRVRPDIVVREDPATHGQGRTLLVIDTKWKTPSRGVPSDEDLKQMFVYNELLQSKRSILLYPATHASVPGVGTYAKRDHGCEQVHLGLLDGSGWSTKIMRMQLAALLENLRPETPMAATASTKDRGESEAAR